jgi:Co/Zn/Cd efflux system component
VTTDDINMRSAWLCSRNDVAANGGVLVAAAGVLVTAAAWPDVAMGVAIALLFGASASDVSVVHGISVRPACAQPRRGRRSCPR